MNIMIDLETMGNKPDAAIIALGAVEFDPVVGLLGREFYEVISLESAMEQRGTVDAPTILWWMKQSDEAREEFFGDASPIEDVLRRFSRWFSEGSSVWGNGATFDNVILRSAYERSTHQCPWDFWQDRCFRTMNAEHPPIDTSGWQAGGAHNALEDAKWQARYLVELMQRGWRRAE